MTAQAIGSLFVALGLDSAEFTAGVKQVQAASDRIAARFRQFGSQAEAVGKKLSVASAAMAAFGTAAFAMVKGTADAGNMIARQSQIANTSADQFQRWAAGAKTVGIEQDKLADILKDVNDRVGDFNATGGGPMADFFENIAPNVGITEEAFKGLSGADALQLYVSSLEKAGVSQQQMTFYLEAMASDATALIPLLENGGAEMTRYGDAAAAAGGILSGDTIKASKSFADEISRLTQGLTGVKTGISDALLPAMIGLLEYINANIIPGLQTLGEKVGGVIQWFTDLPGPVQEAAAVIAGALAAGGPILIGIGLVSRALGALVVATGPIGLFIGAASLAVAAWMAWGDDIKRIVGNGVNWLREKFAAVGAFFREHGRTIALAASGPPGLILLAWERWGEDIKAALSKGLDWIRTQFDDLMTWFEALPGRMLEFGRNIVQGLIDGIMERWEALKARVIGLADSLPNWVKDALDIRSPSRVMMEIGGFVTEGLALGIAQGTDGVRAAVAGVTDAVNGAGTSLSDSMSDFAQSASQAFASVISGSAKVKDALRSLAASWFSKKAGQFLDAGISGLFGALKIPGFASGTNDFAGGLARVNERGGEIMRLPSGTQIIPHDISKRMADGAGGMSALRVELGEGLVGQILQQAGAQSIEIVRANNKALPGMMSQINANPRRR